MLVRRRDVFPSRTSMVYQKRIVSDGFIVGKLPYRRLVHQGEIELAFLDVCPCHFDAHRIAQAITMMPATPHKAIVSLVEIIIIVV